MHDRIIEWTGGERGLLTASPLDAAVERARWGPFVRGDLAERAAFLLRGIALDHPFADGNKRTAFELADVFLRRNGAVLDAPEDEVVQFMLSAAQGGQTLADLAAWLRAHASRYKPWTSLLGGVERKRGPRMEPATEQALRASSAKNRRALERLAKL